MNFFQKLFKTTEMHSLAVYGSLCGEKQFLFIFIPFYWLFKQIQIFLSFASFKHNMKNKLSEYFCARFCDKNFYV